MLSSGEREGGEARAEQSIEQQKRKTQIEGRGWSPVLEPINQKQATARSTWARPPWRRARRCLMRIHANAAFSKTTEDEPSPTLAHQKADRDRLAPIRSEPKTQSGPEENNYRSGRASSLQDRIELSGFSNRITIPWRVGPISFWRPRVRIHNSTS